MEKNGELKKTPLCRWHREHGGKMVDFGGWEMPVQYEPGIVQEHLATRRYGGLFDVSHMGRFRFKGQDLIPFLQKVMTNNCQALEPWKSQYTIIQNENGGALDDAFLYRFGGEDYLMVVNASNLEKDWAHFQEQAAGFKDLTLEDHSQKLAMIAFQGPLAREVLEKVCQGGFMPEPRQNNLSQTSIQGTEILLSRTGYTGEPNSFELFVPAEKAEEIWDVLYNESKDQGVVPVGLGARDTLRLEASMPLYGHELGLDLEDKEIPIFAIPLSTVAVSFSDLKGSFIGREALAAQFEALKEIRSGADKPPASLPKRIMSVALVDRGIARQGHEVFVGDRKIGTISSGTSCPYWKLKGQGAMMQPAEESALRSLALAYLDSTVKPGTEVEIEVRKKRIRAKVVKFHGKSDMSPYYHALPVE